MKKYFCQPPAILGFLIVTLTLLLTSACSEKKATSFESSTFSQIEYAQIESQKVQGLSKQGPAFILNAEDGRTIRIRPYGDGMIRLQSKRKGEQFFADYHYEMVASHDWPSDFGVFESEEHFEFRSPTITLNIDRSSLAAKFSINDKLVLEEKDAVTWENNHITASFVVDESEHFTGLGHSYYAREESLDLRGKTVQRNYGREQKEQAPLIVPFYLSSKGYGIFLNSTFANAFSFADQGNYSFSIDDRGFDGRMDYFFIAGPKLPKVIDRYTQLTGRPRLPMKSMFGLQLSDKGHDHNSPTPSNEDWWKKKITQHRAAGFPLDHVVNDNRWRAAGGKRCESKLEWDKGRYPNPKAYGQWLTDNGLVTTLDFNRCIGQYSDGWQPSFNLPETGLIDFKESAPDLTNPAFRKWFWQLFYSKALAPEKNFPGDALWIDEFDEQGGAPMDMLLANGRSSAEMRNYWFFLIAKALVAEGWDKSSLVNRPYVWVRGMTAGGQRYATLWSGDIYPNYKDMKTQIRSMQLAGLSGFPYWGHDAGGFFDWEQSVGPDENLYQRWAMAFGSFAPIWKPHGMGQSRWPLDRSKASQATAKHFTRLRYELLPYTYSAAHIAAQSGLPITRPMLLEYPELEEAWQRDLQYLWGSNILIAPQTKDSGEMDLWLPPGKWFAYRDHTPLNGDRVLTLTPKLDELPIFVKAGAIVPQRDYALSSAFIDKRRLVLDVYAGQDGEFLLIEDDDKTEAYREHKAIMQTFLRYNDKEKTLYIDPAKGKYQGAPSSRRYTVNVYGLKDMDSATVNGEQYPITKGTADSLQINIPEMPIDKALALQLKAAH